MHEAKPSSSRRWRRGAAGVLGAAFALGLVALGCGPQKIYHMPKTAQGRSCVARCRSESRMCPADCLSNYPISLNDKGVDQNAIARSTCMIGCNNKWEPCILGCGATIEYVEEGQSPIETAEGSEGDAPRPSQPAAPPPPPPFEQDDEVYCQGRGAGSVYEMRKDGQVSVNLTGGIFEVPAHLCRKVPFRDADYVACNWEDRGIYYDAFVDRISHDGSVYVSYDGMGKQQEATTYELCRSRRIEEGETFGEPAGGFEMGQRVQCRRGEIHLHGWVLDEPKRSHMSVVIDGEVDKLYARRDCRLAPEQPAEGSSLGEILSCPDGLFRADAMIVKDNGDGTFVPFRLKKPRFNLPDARMSDCRRDRPLAEPPAVGDRISCALPGVPGSYQDVKVLSVSGDRLEAVADQGAKLKLDRDACREIGPPAK